MKNSLKDLTVNVKKSIDREYDNNLNLGKSYDDDQKMLDDNIITSIEDSYSEDDYQAIVVDRSDSEDIIEPEKEAGIDTIHLTKVRSLRILNKELDSITKTKVPTIIDFQYLQERRSADFKKVGSTLKDYKSSTGASVILLGNAKTVVLVVPPEIRVIKN